MVFGTGLEVFYGLSRVLRHLHMLGIPGTQQSYYTLELGLSVVFAASSYTGP